MPIPYHQSVACPLCRRQASASACDGRVRAIIHCTRCTSFELTRLAFSELRRMESAGLEALSRLARSAPRGRRLFIQRAADGGAVYIEAKARSDRLPQDWVPPRAESSASL